MTSCTLSKVSDDHGGDIILGVLKEIFYPLLERYEVGVIVIPWEGRRPEDDYSCDWIQTAARWTPFSALTSTWWWTDYWWNRNISTMLDCSAEVTLSVPCFLAHWIICQSVKILTHIISSWLEKNKNICELIHTLLGGLY